MISSRGLCSSPALGRWARRKSNLASFASSLVLLALLALGLARPSNADVPESSCNIATGTVALERGTIHYRQAGAGTSLLLLHGLFANKEQWDGMLCLLAAAGYSAIAPDLPGYGQSTTFPITDYPLENQVARLHEFVERMGIKRLDIAGNSMGGAIAALYVHKYPEQVQTLAFIGGPLGITEWHPQVKNALYQGINPFIPVDIAQFDLELSLLFVNPPPLPEAVKHAAIKDYVERNRYYQQVWSIVSLYNQSLELPRFWVRTPTLILWGKQDQIFSIDGAINLHQRYPRGELVRLANVGHLPHLEHPLETANIYLDFLRHWSKTRNYWLE